MICPLCELKPEEILFHDRHVIVAETKSKKGHWSRIMVLSTKHTDTVPGWLEGYALWRLEQMGRLPRAFGKCPKFVIMSPLLGSIPDHWHYVATDLDPEADDFEQILRTPWIKVVEMQAG